MADAPFRARFDMGLERTVAWLESWHGDRSAFSVEPVAVEFPDVRALTEREAARLRDLRSERESGLHSYLKFAAIKWVESHSSHPETIVSEVTCYAPVEERCRGISCADAFGLEIDIGSPQLLYDEWLAFPVSYGVTVRLDLHAFDIAVEVGGTQPVNLLLPLLQGLADRSLWIPYPPGTSPSEFELEGSPASMPAYRIRLWSVPPERLKRTPELNRRGPHPYPLGSRFEQWFIEQHGEMAPGIAEERARAADEAGEREIAFNWTMVAESVADLLAGSNQACRARRPAG